MKKYNIGHYKYIHVLWHDELKFSSRIVKLMSEDYPEIESKQHYFITPFINVYEALKDYGNVAYIELKKPYSYKIINIAGKHGDWIFLHNICRHIELLKVNPKYLKKIIWRTWGGDRLNKIIRKNIIKKALVALINFETKRRVKKFKIIGVSNEVDIVELTDRFGKLNYMREPYFCEDNNLRISPENEIKSTTINILIGHSGFSEDNHIKISKKLERFKNEDIKLHIPFSYGYKGYIAKTKEHLANQWGNKVVFIDDFLDFNDYAKLLANMDIAFLDTPFSCALGNIALLVCFNKKIFLRKNGVIARAFDKCEAPYFTSDELGDMTFEEFSKPVVYKGEKWKDLSPKSFSENMKYWEDIIKVLNEK